MNETKQYLPYPQPPSLGRIINEPNQCTDPIRKPAISAALDQLEKQLAELCEQWNLCAQKISPLMSPFQKCDPNERCNEESSYTGPALASRINDLSRHAKNICDIIRETTNQIEL